MQHNDSIQPLAADLSRSCRQHPVLQLGAAMILTQQQAEEKWCPHARAVIGYMQDRQGYKSEAIVANRTDSDQGTMCVGSACMQWRWHGRFNADGRFLRKMARGYYESSKDTVPVGYCGLAGRPE